MGCWYSRASRSVIGTRALRANPHALGESLRVGQIDDQLVAGRFDFRQALANRVVDQHPIVLGPVGIQEQWREVQLGLEPRQPLLFRQVTHLALRGQPAQEQRLVLLDGGGVGVAQVDAFVLEGLGDVEMQPGETLDRGEQDEAHERHGVVHRARRLSCQTKVPRLLLVDVRAAPALLSP